MHTGQLSTAHRQHLLSELGPEGVELAIRYGARSIDAEEAQRLGFRWGSHRTGGLLLPFGGDFAQLRCDDPPITAGGDPVKYLNRAGVKQAPATFGDGEPTIATEGWKDGITLHLRTGETAQAIPGVTAHKGMAPTVKRLIYDADARENPAVWSQLVAAGLQRRILRVGFFPEEIAGPKGGACEFFANDGDFESIAWHKPRALLTELPKGWKPSMRADWKPRAIRMLARLAIRAGLGKQSGRQIVADAAKGIRLPVQQARETFAAEQRRAAPPPKQAPASAPAHVRLIAAVGDGPPPEIKVDAGFWASCLSRDVGHRLRRNLLTQRVELDGAEIPAESEELLYVWAQRSGWRISKPDCYDGTRALAVENSYHPVREYLNRVADDPTIDAADLDSVAARYLGVSDELSASMLRCLLIGAVARVHQPGCEAPGVVVLRGAQGIGKSRFWAGLAGDFYVVSREHDSPKDQAMAMHRSWFYDMDELDKVTTAKQAAGLRSLITAPADTFRLPYSIREEKFPRQFVIVGAVNGDGFLTDPEGNRRYWVIDCPQAKDSGMFIDGPGAARDRDAIWKAAVIAYRSGERWTLNPEEQKASNSRNGQWEAIDEWQAPLAGWAERTRTPGGFTTREAIEGAGLRKPETIQRNDEMRAAQSLRRAGFHRQKSMTTRPDGRRDRFWTVTTEQPEQPRATSGGEVAHRKIPVPACDLTHTEQPEQPLSGKSWETKKTGHQGGGAVAPVVSLGEVWPESVAQVAQSAPNRLRRGAFEGEQPPGQDLEVAQSEVAQPRLAASLPAPQVHPDCRMEVSTWVAAARDALADAGQPHDARACWECLQSWQPEAPTISQGQVKGALDRLAPYIGAQPGLPGVA